MRVPPLLLIFDCGGVLIDSEVIGCRVKGVRLAGQGIAISAGELVRAPT